MAVNPNSLKNLEKGKKFTPNDARIKNGRTAGVKNRKTIFGQVVNIRSKCTGLTGKATTMSQGEQIAVALVNKAKQGDVSAANMVFDSAYGKIGNEHEPQPEPVTPQIDWSKYTDEELQLLATLMEKGTSGNG